MITAEKTFSSFSVDDLKTAEEFYGRTLGLNVHREGEMGLVLKFDAAEIFIYPKPDHQPATFTVLNFQVRDIEAAVNALTRAGIALERYEGIPADEKGIARGIAENRGPDIAWFKDPAGNVLSVLQIA